MSYTYQYPRPALTVDCVIFHGKEEEIKILLIKRLDDPFKGFWALPGGFMEIDETLDVAAARELQEETGLENVELKRLGIYDQVNRDPRGRTISMAFVGSIKELKGKAGSDASEVKWFKVKELPRLAFDHANIIEDARKLVDS